MSSSVAVPVDLPSPQSVRLRRWFATRVRPLAERSSPRGYQLRALRSTADSAGLTRLPRGTRAWPARYGSVRGVWLQPPGADPARGALLYLHGGGFVFGSPRSHRTLAFRLARRIGVPVFLLDYRRAPEHRFPAAADDALAAYRLLLARGFPADRISVAGDSAGGQLTAGLLDDLVRLRLPRPARALLLSPWLDFDLTELRRRDRERRDPFVPPSYVEKCRAAYLGGPDHAHPRLDVLGTDKTGWPPVLVQVGDTECLLGDAERLAAKVRAAGGTAELQVWPGQIHVFPIFAGYLPEAGTAVRLAGRFLRGEPAE
ncbi:Acetyl esterase/lipase [Amycolatopsis arida]|uniref:Acetyl esterase/lipase n=1 Tax=Amycolatopsis arida TaxID=587909 RepID=A0A1I5YZ19_9PSEU|nr:alpha/beta hydrolase fold domain-containing protein [Amycolatopsis arida]TDX89991.1 acetyl esterase/lipase [Amycolatopsis arida]SFQ49449.1 Acetyl esterase/lipase [Amycolatopsis arida]